jgi:HEAT repeats/PBS lyase HEAT-like repeat
MPDLSDARPTLTTEEATRLVEFARACKAAARAVLLYPAGHPAIAATLGRIVQVTSPAALTAPLVVTVLPDGLLLDERAPARPEGSLTELAALLHSHLIGQLTVHPGGDIEAWRMFLLLLGRTPESVRTDGGIARVWTTMAGRHVELREIDYTEVLRERAGGQNAVWDRVVTNCLQGNAFELDDAAINDLIGLAGNADQLCDLMSAVESKMETAGGIGAKTAAVLRMIRGIIDVVSKNAPDRVEPVLQNMAAAVGHLSPEMLLGLLEKRRSADEGAQVVQAVASRMSEGTIAAFVSRQVIAQSSPTDRVAQAFQALVRDPDQQERLLSLARTNVAASPLGSTEGFEDVWNHVAQKLLTSYTDESYVSEEYGRELSGARTQAVEVERVSDDPPERVSAWLGTVATSALRSLDLQLFLDLLRIENDDERWGELMAPVVSLLEDLLLVGDFDAASELLAIVVGEASGAGSKAHRQDATIAIDMLVGGSMMRHIVTHLATVDEPQFERIKALCVSLGEVLVRPLAEALSVESRPRTRQRLTAILLAFGAVARRTIERLKNSQNPVVRRTAIQMMREFGGSDALPDLTELLDDNEPQVQREAVRAILNIGTEAAYKILEQALTTGTLQSRDAIMQSISTVRDERATPLFAYIIEHVDHRGPLRAVYLSAIESLGALKDPAGIAPLKDALRKGEWWAPRRTAALRHAAAAALGRIGTPDAIAALEQAIAEGSRGMRAAARAHLPNRSAQ